VRLSEHARIEMMKHGLILIQLWIVCSLSVPCCADAVNSTVASSILQGTRRGTNFQRSRNVLPQSSNMSNKAEFQLRGHTDNKNLHQIVVCANPQSPFQRTALSQSCAAVGGWAGGNIQKCKAIQIQPECITKQVVCLNGEVALPPYTECSFPFEYQGVLHTQCYLEPGGPAEPWCFDTPNFATPCSFAAKLAGCVDDAATREAYAANKVKSPCNCSEKGTWNAPPSGGTILSIIGSGFGDSEKPCDDKYLDCIKAAAPAVAPATMETECIRSVYGANSEYLPRISTDLLNLSAFPQNCRYHQVLVGYTAGTVTWTSDTSLSLIVPPGIGKDLNVDVIVGRFKHSVDEYSINPLDKLFTYDR
jgi:hypothetical protein